MGAVRHQSNGIRRLRIALLASTALALVSTLSAAGTARAQDATWLANPASGDFNTGTNWSSGTVPTGTASFGTSSTTSLSFGAATTIGGWTFNAGAGNYTFNNSQSLYFTGAGIVVNGGSASITNSGTLQFANSSSSGSASIDNTGDLSFIGTATAANSSISNSSTGAVLFADSSTAGNATITSNYLLYFTNSSTAGSATITNNAGAAFQNSATAGNATIINNGGLTFRANSTAGNAAIVNNAGGSVDFSTATGPAGDGKLTAGSIAGAGNYNLGSNQLTVGSNGLETEVSGVISGNGGSLVMTGTGKLTLSGANTYTGGTTVSGGTLQLGTVSSTGTIQGVVQVDASGTLNFVNTDTSTITSFSNSGTTNFLNHSDAGNLALNNNLGGVIDFSATTGPAGDGKITAGSIAGAGNYNLGSNQLTVGSNDLSTEVSGVISGAGGSLVKTGTGMLMLSGANTYSGGTTVNGGVLQLGSAGGVGSLAGAVTVGNHGTFSVVNADTSGITSISNGGTTNFANSTSAGNAAIANSGTLNFSDASTGGSASITNDGNVYFYNNSTGGNAAIVNNLSGVVDFSATSGAAGDGKVTAGSIAGAGTYNLGSNQLTVGSDGLSTEVSGVISGTGGSLVKTGNGTLTLSGANTYTGGTTVNGGTLQLGTVSSTGQVMGPVTVGAQGTLNFVNADTSTIGTLLNNGTTNFLNNSNAGNLALVNNAGGVVDFSGTLGAAGDGNISAGSIAGAGNFYLGANHLTVGGNDTRTEVSGVISGTGSLEKTGYNTLVLSGVNTYSGGTAVSNGTLELGTATNVGSVAGAVSVVGTGNLRIVNSSTASISSVNIRDSGLVAFINTSSAGSVTINVGTGDYRNPAAQLYFNDTTTAGNATIINNGRTTFQATSSAGSATITNNTIGVTSFIANSSAGNATIVVNDYGQLNFSDNSSAGHATITNNDLTYFYNNSSADNATITNNGGISFNNYSTAGTAAIINNGGLSFLGASNAGTAAITNNASGSVDFSDTTGLAGDGKLTAGSIAGAGLYNIGGITVAIELTVGSNDLSTEVSGVIAGAGGALVKVGGGKLTLSGANTYSGGTTLAGGTVSVSSDANLGDAAGALTFNGGTLQVTGTSFHATARTINWGAGGGGFDIADATNTFTVSQVLGGSGGLTKLGAGTLALSGANTYAGGTTFVGGAVSVSSDASLGDAAGALTFNGGVLKVTGTSLNATARTINWGAGGGGFDIADAANTFTVGQALGGSGGLTKLGAGTLVLSGTSTYTGGTTVSGGVLQLGNSGSTGAIAGTVTTGAGGTFNLVNADTSAIAGISNAGRTNFLNSSSAGTIAITNDGSLSFTDSSTASSAVVTTNSGATTAFTGNSSGGSARFVTNAGGTFDISGLTASAIAVGSIEGAGAYVLGAKELTVGSNDLLTNMSGVISGVGGSLVKTGRGSLTLSGANTYTGGTTINSGTLRLGDSNSAGALEGVVTVNNGSAFLIANAVTNGLTIANAGGTIFENTTSAGSATITNDASLTFFDTSTAGSATIINNATLTFDNASTAGHAAITNDGVLYFRSANTAGGASITNNNILYFLGISTAGNAAITNNGTVSFSGASTAGSAAITNNGSLYFLGMSTAGNAAITNNAGHTVDFSGSSGPAGDYKISAGSIAGAGYYILGADELTVGSNNLSSMMSGVISGLGGSLVKAGTGTLTLAGVETYTGATAVDGGTLAVNGSITASSGVTVNNGGTLAGTGVVGAVTVNSGGTIAAGNGTLASSLTITGSLALQSGAFYMVQINPTTSSFANVSGTATLGGSTVKAVFANGGYVAKQYIILTAGSVSGSFGAVAETNRPSNFHTALSYDATHAYLNLILSFIPPQGGGLGGNQQNVGNAIVNSFNANGGISLVYSGLTSAGLTQASGETAAGSQQTSFQAMGQFMGLLTDPFSSARETGASAPPAYANDDGPASHLRDGFAMLAKASPVTAYDRWSVWAAGFGGSQTTDGSTVLGSNSATSRLFGTAAGAEYAFTPQTLAGFALAGGGTSFSVANGGSGRSDLFQAGVYLRHSNGPSYIAAALAYGWQDITTDRTVTLAGVDRLRAEFDANAWSGRVEGGYRFVAPWVGGVGLTPYAAGQFATVNLPAYAESVVSGRGAFALFYAAKSVTDIRSELGLRADKSFAMTNGVLTLRGRAAWAHDFDPNRSIAATFQALPGASFVVNGARAASDSALTTASAEMKWLNGWSAAASFEGEFSEVTRSYAGKGTLRYAW